LNLTAGQNSTLAGDAPPGNRFSSGPAIVAYVAAAKFLLHFVTAGLYGLFIDELYFLACGEHLAWGYVDMPPLTAFQAWLARGLFGDSPYSIRLFPSLAGAGIVLLAGALAREMGGKRFAQGLAALAAFSAPIYMFTCSYLSMNAVEPVIWMGCALVLLRIVRTGDTRLWLLFGAIGGMGLLNKQTALLFCFALVAGLALTPHRRLMASRWFLLGGALAALIELPNLVWMISHHFPHLELLANIRRNGRDVDLGLLGFLKFEVLLLNPVATPLWLLGLWRLLRGRDAARYRALGWAFLVTFAILALTPGSHKSYYLAPAYPMLFASGAIALEGWWSRPGREWLKPASALTLSLVGLILAPAAMPLLPPETYLRYSSTFHISQPRIENRATNALPQFFADRFGWPEMAETVARVYNALPPEERAKAAIFGNDFGQAGAIDFYGPRLGLPKAIGSHLTYWYWGPRDYTGEILIILGDTPQGASKWFDSVEEVAVMDHPYTMDQEHFSVLLCRKPRAGTLAQMWPRLKKWD
jgi:dolichyl-phosphate-mannose-protein mannosyltransferase